MNLVASRIKFFTLLFMMFGSYAFGADSPIEAFKDTFFTQVQNYVIPVILIVTLVASGITFMKTKDWTMSLVVGAIAGAIVGGSPSLVAMFTDFNISTSG